MCSCQRVGESETPTLQLLSEHGEEDGEVDGAAGLLDHGLQLLVLHVQLAWTPQKHLALAQGIT